MVVSSCVVLQRWFAVAFYRAWKRNRSFRFSRNIRHEIAKRQHFPL